MKLFDAHNHVQDERLAPEFESMMQRAQDAGVVAMGVKGCCEADWMRVVGIMESYEGIYPAFGLHPWFISERSERWLSTLEDLLARYPRASVGEIGIDHKLEAFDQADQEAVFLAQLELARTLKRPVSIHCRQAWGRLIELLDEVGELPCGMLIHCFGGSAETALELVRRGGYISFSGSITRPNNRKAGPAIRAVPDDRIVIETDAPDIMPYNGRTEMVENLSAAAGRAAPVPALQEMLNEPANLLHVLDMAAGLRGIAATELAAMTFRNTERFFQGLA